MLKNLPKKIQITEVGPRDGLQNEKKIISLEEKVKFIIRLVESGIKQIEATSFVKPGKIPQMSDAKALFLKIKNEPVLQDVSLQCLVPNINGLDSALEVGVKEIAVFTSTSNSFNLKNINANIDESLIKIQEIVKKSTSSILKIRGYISTVFGCPYEGETSLETLVTITEKLFELGIYEISLGDTIGVATPKKVLEVIDVLKKRFPLEKFAMHFHDTRGMAIANILTSLELGITNFDSSAGGLGGCPYAKGSSGNVATEELVYLSNSLNITTGIDLEKLIFASREIYNILEKPFSSKYLQSTIHKN